MANSSYESSSEEEHILYKNRPEWNDIVPLTQDDGPNPVVRIAYTDAFQDTYDYFRAIVHKGELSERALTLTEDAIHMNPANYSVWEYRRRIIKHIKADLRDELDFCREMIEGNPKNYQVWHHRRVIVQWLNDPSKELILTKIVFSADAKNYHAWEHRQWVLRTFKLFDGELDFINQLLTQDIRNNSAWNQRYFVCSLSTGFTEEVVERETAYAKRAINVLPNNESPWNYLKGILKHAGVEMYQNENIVPWLKILLGTEEKNCPFVLSFQLDLLKNKLKNDPSEKQSDLQKATKICEDLATNHDSIRREYWRYMQRSLQSKYG